MRTTRPINPPSTRIRVVTPAWFPVWLLCAVAWAGSASAVTINVETTTDELVANSVCSLREAIFSGVGATDYPECELGSGAGADVIQLAASTYTITITGTDDTAVAGDLDVDGTLTIQGPTGQVATIVAATGDRAIHVISGTITLERLVIDGGSGVDGAGVQVNSGASFSAVDTRFQGGDGRAAANCPASSPPGLGGAILTAGTVTLTRCLIDSNTAGAGGAIAATAGTVTIANSTITANTGDTGGGCPPPVAGILAQGGADIVLNNVTLAGNSNDTADPDGLVASGAGSTIIYRNSVISDACAAPSSGSITSNNFNAASGTGCPVGGANDTTTAATLGALGNNGGLTSTMLPALGSNVIGTGNCTDSASNPVTEDQTALFTRTSPCDIGAFETRCPNDAGCNDSDSCTTDTCNRATGCTNSTAASRCTSNGTCAASVCTCNAGRFGSRCEHTVLVSAAATATAGANWVVSPAVTNAGSVASTTSTVKLTVPSGTTFASGTGCSESANIVTCTLGSIAAGATTSVGVSFLVDPSAVIGAGLTTTISTTSFGEATGGITTTASTTVVRSSDLDLTVTAPANVNAGATLIYTVAVNNNGPSTSAGTEVSIPVPAGTTYSTSSVTCSGGSTRTCALGTIALGGTSTFTIEFLVPATVGTGTVLASTLSVSSTSDESIPSNNTKSASTSVTRASNLAISASAPANVTAGGSLSYTVSVSNAGPSSASTTVVSVPIPSGTTYASSTVACTGSGPLSCALGSLDVSGSAGFTITFNVGASAAAGANLTSTLTASSASTDGTPGNNTAALSSSVVRSSDLSSLTSSAPTSATAGANWLVTLQVQNLGPSDAASAFVETTIPSGLTYVDASSTAICADTGGGKVKCDVTGAFTPGSTSNFTVAFAVPASASSGTAFATTTGVGSASSDGTASNNATTLNGTSARASDLSVSASTGPASVTAGNTLTYGIVAANAGPSNASNVVVEVTYPANATFVPGSSDAACGDLLTKVQCSFSSINAGANRSFNVVFTSNPSSTAGTPLGSTVTVSSASPDPTPGNDTKVFSTDVTRSSDLAGNTASAPATVPAGSNWMVTLPLSNVGPSDAASAFIETTIPSGTTFVPASSSGACTPVSSKIRCAAGTLTAGSSTSMAVAFAVANTALSGAVLAAVVTTGSDSPDAVATNNGITVNGTVTRFDLNLTAMTANPTSATPGATVAYTINYTNEGSAGATGVTISETVPPNTRFDVATSSPTVWSCADQSTAGTSCTTTVGTVNAGGFGNVRFGVRVVNPVPAGTTSIANTATIASVGGVGIDADPVDDTRSLSINVTAAPIVTASFVDTHHVDVDSDGLVEPGDTLRYTLTVANTGNTDASAVVFAGSIPANTSYVASSLKVNGSAAPGTVSSVTIGTVAGSASATVTFDVTVNSPLAAGVAAVTATGVVQGSNFTQLSTDDPSTVAAADATVTPVDAAPNLAVTKTTSSTNLSPGGTATFNLGTSNAGNQAATGVILTETVPPGATYDSAASAPSVWSCANGSVAGTSCTLSIGAMAVGAGPSHKFVVKVVNPLTSALTAVANTVAISDDLANGADPVTSNNTASASASIASLPDAFVSVTSTTTEAATGATISYAVSYGNKGTANITSQTVTLTVPPKTTFLPDQSSTLWSCPGAGLGGTTCSFSGAQTAGTNASAPFVVKVDDILTATDTAISLVLSTTIAGSPAQLDATNDATTLVIPVRQAPDLQVTATAGSPTVVAGQTLVYTASWKNIGTRTSTGVVLSATVPASATYVVGGDTPAWTCPNGGVAGSVCTLSLGDIPTVTANASAGQGTRTFTVVVAASVPESFSGVTSTLSITDAGVNPSELNTTNNQAEVTTPVKAAPDLALTAVASGGSVTVGTLQVYTFTYRNLGNALSKGVEVTVNVPNNATSNAAAVSPTTWSCPDGSAAGTPCVFDVGDLAAGATGTVDFAVTVDSTLPRTVSNVVMTADLQDDPGDPANVPEIVTSNNGASITTPVDKLPDLKVTMSATVQGGGAVQPGSIITYTLNYSNVGNQTAFVPVLTQTIPVYTTFTPDGPTSFVCSQGTGGGKSCTLSLPNLAPFASGSATFRVTVDAALPAQATEIVSTASIAGSGNDLNFTDNTASVTSSIGTAPDPALISLSHNAPGAGVKPNDPIIYTITYNNLGSATATTVHLAVTVPAETSFRSTGSTAGWSCNPAAGQAGSVCRLSVGPITSNKAPTPTATFALLVDPEVAADVTQIPLTAAIEITGTGELSTANNSQSATVNVAALPDLIISDIDDGDVTVGLGDTLTYAITYENVGRLNASGVSLRETVPVGTSFLAASSTQGWNCTPAAGLAGAVCTFTVGALAINTPSSVLFAVKVNSTLTKNEANLTNTAQVLAGGSQAELSTANNTLTELTPVEPGPEIVVTKIADSTVVTTNQTVKYTLTIENRGTADATGVVVTERVPANTTFVEGVDVNQDSSAPIVWGCATVAGGTPCPLTIGSLPKNGAPLKLTFTVKVNASLNQVAKITNQVSIADDNAHGDELDASNDSFTHEVQVGGAPDLSVSAVATPANVVAGSLVNLDFSYRNAGSEPANSVTLAVTLPPKVARNPLVGDTNWICVVQTGGGFNCTLALGSVGAGVGPITKRLGLKLASAFTATDLELVMPSSITINDPGIIDLNPPDNAASTTLSVLAGPLMTLQKTTTTVQAKVNEPIIYTLAWQNLGRNGATGVILTETIPETTTFNAGASDPNWVCEGVTPGKKCILQIGDVGVFVDGEPIPTALFAVTVDPVIPPSVTDIINVAALTQDGTNGTDLALGAAGEKTVATLARGPDLVLGATSTKNPALVGDTVRYTLNLSNNGTADANAILLTAKVPLNTTFKPATSSPDWNCLNGGVALDTCTLLLTGVTLGQPGNVNGTPTSTSRLFDVTVAATLPAGANKTTFEATSLAGGAADLASDNNGTTLEIALIGAPNLRAELAGPAAADPGQDLTYTVTLSNLGTRGSSGVVASMKVPLNSRYKAAGGDAWNCPTTVGGSTCTIPVGVIEPGATKTLTFLATVDLPLAANIVSTSAQASVSDDGANGTDSAPANNTSASVVTTLDAEPALAIDYKAPTSSSPGSTLTYSLDYWNAGDQNASGVKLTAVVPASTVFSTASSTAGWDCDPSTGAAGAICTLAVVGEVLGNRSSATASTATFSVIVDSKLPSGLESTSSTATIRDDIDLLVIDGTDTVVVQLESAPDLTITQSVGAQTFEPGDNITFNLTMKNTGSQTADNVEVTAKVPANTTFQSALSTQGWTCDPPSGVAGATCKLPVGTLAVGTNVLPFPASFILKVDSPIAAGVIQTTGEVSVSDDGVNGPDLNPANNAQSRTVAISADPALQLTKKADVTTREPGEKIIYTLEYQNVGTQHSTGVVITDVVPVNTIFDPDASSPGWSCSGTVAGATCTFADPTLPVGQKRTLTYAVNITDAVPAGVVSVQNKATITDDGQNHDDNVARLVNSNTVTTSIEAVAGLNISFVNPQASVPPGGRANFTIAYSNTGLQEATGVNVVVTVPAGTTFDANGSVTKGWTCAVPNGGVLTVCTHSVGNIPVGATAGGQVSFTLEVSPTIPGPPAGLPDAFALEARLVETGGDGGATPASKTQVTLVARCSTEFNFETSGGSVQTSALWQYVAGGSLGGGYWKTGGEANVLEADPDIAHLNFTIPIPSTATGGLQPLVEVVFKHTGEVAPQRDFLALCLQEPKADGSPDYSCNVIKSQYNTSQNTKDNTRQANAGPFDFNDGTFDHVLLDASAFAGRNVTLSVVYQTNGSNDANPGLAILSVRQYSDADRDESLDGSSLLCDVCWDTDRDGYFNSGSPGYVAFVPARSCGKSAEDVELVDCDDTDGNLELDCSEDCADGIDNNNNGLVDCEDNLGLGCAVDPICSPCERTFTFDSAKNDNGWLVQGDAIFDVVRTPGASGFVTTAGTGKKRYTSYLVRDVIIPAGMPKPKVEVTFTLEGSTAAATDKIGVCFDTKPITNCASNALADVDENTGPTPQTIVLNVPPEKVGNGGKLNIGIYYDSVAPVDAPAKILIDQVAVRSDIDADERYENLDPTCDRCIDRDGDGYGDASDSFNDSSTCKTALGLPATTPDCNDANEGVNPGIGVADECARTGDQNCDNVADIADASCSRCGDGLVTAGEQCDDGDGTCKPWEPVLTGGNPVQCPAISEDGCSSTCQIEANVAPLYLSEVHLTRFGQAGGQYFELYNKSNSTVDPLLLGLNFSNKLGQKQNFSACNLKKSVIAPKSYYVVSLGVEGQTGDIVADAYCTGVVLSEAGDSLALKNGDGTQVIDTVDFSAFGCETTQSLAGSGLQRSIELVDPTTRSASLNDTASAWCVSRQKVLKADGTPTASDNYGSPGGPGQCGELFCDGIDDDCDGNGPDEIDPDLPDADFDGFCDNPVTTGVGDCDKTTALCHVDCTTNVDATDAIPDVPDCRDRCIDKDNDGYGAPGNNTTLVSEPSNSPCLGIVSQKDDCTFCKANPNEPSCVVCSFGSSLDPKCAEDCNTLDGTTLLDAGVTNCRYPRYECNVCLGAVDTIGDCGCNKPENAQLDKCKFTIPGKTCNDAPVQICEAGTCVALRAQCEYCKIDTNKEDSALCADCKAGSTNGICAPDCNLVPENSCDTLVCTNPRDECQACAANNDFNCQSACVADPASPKCGLGCMKFPTRLCPNLDCFDSDNRVNAGDLEGQPKNPDGSSVAGEAVAGSCTDGVDNDCDGRADCSDEGCAKSPECEGATCEAPLDVQCGYDAVTPVISPDYLCSSRGDKGNDAVLRFRATAPQFKDGGKVTILIDNKANPSSYAVRIFEDTCPGASCPSSEADGGFVPAFCGESKPADIDVTFGQEVYIVVDEEIAGCGSPGESAARVTIRCNEDCGFPGDDDADGKEDCFDEECISEKVCADADFDGDGFKNGEELKCGKSAQSKADKPSLVDLDDTDADGTLNCTDVDDDGDGLADTLEGPNKLKTSPVKFDTDGDGLSDGEEDANLNGVYDVAVETNPVSPDTDADALSDGIEAGSCYNVTLGTLTCETSDPLRKDHDGDGLQDGIEDANLNGRVDVGETSPLRADSDGDGFNDGDEFRCLSNPLDGLSVPTFVFYDSLVEPTGDRICDGARVDSDGDGIVDGVEELCGTNGKNGDDFPSQTQLSDTDGDGFIDCIDLDDDDDTIPDVVELRCGYDPKSELTPTGKTEQQVIQDVVDEDGDGLRNCEDSDDDNDGFSDEQEAELGTDPLDADSDDDGLHDGLEGVLGIDPLKTDTDGDGIYDGTEYGRTESILLTLTFGDDTNRAVFRADECPKSTTKPEKPDTDGDGQEDGEEDANQNGCVDGCELAEGFDASLECSEFNPNKQTDVLFDSDGDTIPDTDEKVLGTDPNDSDTDGDRLNDGIELNIHKTDPLNPDTDDGGINDGDEVDNGTNPKKPEDDFLGGRLTGAGTPSCGTATSPSGRSSAILWGLLLAACGAFVLFRRRANKGSER